MTKEEAKILSESMVEMGKMATANSLTFLKNGFEAFKKVKIPMLSADGNCCYGYKMPYTDNEQVRQLVDFMVVYLDEAIKDIDNQIKKDEAKQ